MRKIRVFSVGNKTLGFEEADVADEDKTTIVPEGPLADSMHSALLEVYSTDSKEKEKVNAFLLYSFISSFPITSKSGNIFRKLCFSEILKTHT